MAIIDDVSTQIKEAMRAKDKVRLVALRSIRAGFIEALKSDGAETLSDDKALPILRKLAKMRQESIDLYTQGGRTDLVEQERAELAVIDAFLPSLADEAQTEVWVQEAIAATGASGPREMGKVMGHVMKHHKADVDGKRVKNAALKLLNR
jgi:hypothetical protein